MFEIYTILIVGGIIGGVFLVAWLWDFFHPIPLKEPLHIVIRKCTHINGLGEQLPPTYTVWSKNVFGFDQSVFTECADWDWEGDSPYPKHFNSMDEVNLAIEDRQRNIIKTTCEIIDKG